MALLDFEKKEGLQYGSIGDECYHCRRNRDPEEVYAPKSLDRQLVYKIKIYGNEYCLCEDCFKKTLGSYILLDPKTVMEEPKVEEKKNGGDAKNAKAEKKESAAKKQSNKKEEGEE